MPTQPSPTATSSTFQVGTYAPLTDTFTSVFDLNDGVTTNIMWNTLKLPQPEKAFVRSFNLRAPGERVTRFQYKNRHIQVSVSLRGASVQAILNTCHSLIAAIENPPYRIRLAQPNAMQYSYATVVAVTHNIPADPQTLLAKALPNVQIDFECAPGLLGDRVTLQNLVVNPGFEAPSGPAVTAFADTCANTNAYALQAGGAPTTPASTTYVDVVAADNPLRYYRLDEASGANAYDIAGTNQTATYTASPTLGVAGAISGDTDTAVTFNGTSQYAAVPTTGLPTGNAALTLECWIKFAANPAAVQVPLFYGSTAGGNHNYLQLILNTNGTVAVTGTGADVTSTAALSLNAWHHVAATWDGTTLRLYVDGASTGTPTTPGAQTIPTTGLACRIAANGTSTPGQFFAGSVDEVVLCGTALSSTSVTNHYNAGHTGATGTQANTMSVPAAARVAFGSPAWGALQTWQTRFRWVSGLTGTWYLHYSDASNHLRIDVSSAASGYQIVHTIAGTAHVLASATVALTHEAWYWLQVTQFPAQAANSPWVQATLLYDDTGAIGAAVAGGAIGPAATSDGATALQGRPQLAANGAALVIGGNYTSGVHTVSLFGPGGWSFGGMTGAATGAAALGWEHAQEFSATTYPSGPVASTGAARIALPPAGTVDARLATWDGTAATVAQYGIPTSQNHVLGLALAYKTTAGLSATSAVSLLIGEYTSSGTLLTTGTKAILSGATATNWTAYSGTYTVTNASTAYVRLQLQVTDTTANSANASVWFDNVQCWDQTALNGQTSMPYCELRFPQGPAQLLVSGLLGDLPAPAFVAAGGFTASWPLGGSLTLLLGRRALAHAQAQLIRWPLQASQGGLTPLLDGGSYGGYYLRTGTGQSSALANVLYTAPTPAACLGAYHFVERAQTSQAAGNLANVSSRVAGFEGYAGAFSNQANYFNAYVASQFSAAATWTLVDHGALFVPLFTAGALTDVSQQYAYAYGQWSDTTGGGSQFSFGVPWLLPIDADVLGATLLNPSNAGGAITNAWLWVYSDAQGVNAGSGFAWGFSLETAALPAPAHAVGGPGTTSSGQISINPSATPYLTLDSLAGASAGVSGVNQLAGSLIDQSGALLPLHCEVQYTPLYLYPR